MPSDRARACALLLLLGGCEIEKVATPRTRAFVALHAVLSATAPTQVVLLERTRNGTVQPVAPPFDLTDPVVSDEGVAESGAIVTLTTPSGTTLVASEDNTTRGDGKGAGIYRFPLRGSALERGGTYRLSVLTTAGETLGAETVVPGGIAADSAEERVFDRARDTSIVEWAAAPGARIYFVRIETPFGPRSFFTESTHVRLTGGLRNVDARGLPRVFVPGFQQAITVSAVDSNYYDWFRTHNDPVSGAGLVSRIRGGLGVFGALVRLRFQHVRVVAPQSEPVAGNYRFVGTDAEALSTPYLSLELFVESPAARSDQPDGLSGRYVQRLSIGQGVDPVHGLLGAAQHGRVELAFLREWSARDTADVLTGELRGDTIVGRYRRQGGVARFLRER